jgi:DNA helicase II / ATP-dependent DNA helicase PcrA
MSEQQEPSIAGRGAGLLTKLNAAQQQAVQTIAGPVLVLAGPGSGKTRVLTHRIAYLISEVGVRPQNILAVTFTNKAAREMKERLDALVGAQQAQNLTVGTFHNICVRILRRDIDHLGRERDFTIYDQDDQQRLMRRVLKDLALDEKQYPPRAIHAKISSAKNELVDVDEYQRLAHTYYDEIVARCYARYQALLREANALDFDDLLVETVRLFDQHPAVLEKYQDRYIYLLVDEYQDTNRAQYVLVKQLAAKYRNLFTVGDSDQSIYAFRGADIRNILQFEDDYPDAQVILLEQNYRSTQAILDVAQSLIDAGGKNRHRKQLWTQNEQGLLVSLQECYDQSEEARIVVDEIGRLVNRDGYALGDCAVMYRTNAQSRALEEALVLRGMRYHIVGSVAFYERKEVKDLLAYMRLALNPFDSVSLLRVLNYPGRGIGARTEEQLTAWAAEQNLPVYTALQLLPDPSDKTQEAVGPKAPFNARTSSALRGFLAVIDWLLAQRQELGVVELFDELVEKIGLHEALIREHGPDDGSARFENALELRTVAAEYALLPQENQLPTFLEEVALMASVDELDRGEGQQQDETQRRDRVTCITLHQAKGLEYPVVFLLGLEEGILPHSRSLEDKDQLEEERRLLYVGVTRAQQRLYLLYAFRRTLYGKTNIATPSRFLQDIPPDLLKQPKKRDTAEVTQGSLFTERSSRLLSNGAGRRLGKVITTGSFGGTSSSTSDSNRVKPERRKPSGPTEVSFFAGDRVQHGTFGEGVVVSSRLIEGDEEVTVAFAGAGVKKLLASFAKLEKVAG